MCDIMIRTNIIQMMRCTEFHCHNIYTFLATVVRGWPSVTYNQSKMNCKMNVSLKVMIIGNKYKQSFEHERLISLTVHALCCHAAVCEPYMHFLTAI